jgi:lipoprotein NlpD
LRTRVAKTVLPACLSLLILIPLLDSCASVEIQPRNGVYHTVKKGETLWRICQTYQVDIMSVCVFNGITDPEKIDAGSRLFIPGARAVRRVETNRPDPVPPEGSEPGTAGDPLRSAIRFQWPVAGQVSSGFGARNGGRHDGIDILAPEGTPIHAAEAGKVVYSGHGIKGYGNMIIIQHPKSFSTVYAHNSKNLVSVDDAVVKGQVIGTVGKTGRASTEHLHFEVRLKIKPVDPLAVLPPPAK